MMRRLLTVVVVMLAGAGLYGCASTITSIQLEPDGKYVLTGVEAPGPTGFLWICDYDPKTKTMTVKEEFPR